MIKNVELCVEVSFGLFILFTAALIFSHETYVFSTWHFFNCLERSGSGQRCIGVWPFLFSTVRSAPFATRNLASEALVLWSAAVCGCTPGVNSYRESKRKRIENPLFFHQNPRPRRNTKWQQQKQHKIFQQDKKPHVSLTWLFRSSHTANPNEHTCPPSCNSWMRRIWESV